MYARRSTFYILFKSIVISFVFFDFLSLADA